MKIGWIDSGREPQNAPNSRFPDGVNANLHRGTALSGAAVRHPRRRVRGLRPARGRHSGGPSRRSSNPQDRLQAGDDAMSADKPDLQQRLLLLGATFRLEHAKEITDIGGNVCDLYVLGELDPPDGSIITICLSRGLPEVAEYIARCCRAGQAVLRQLPLDAPFVPDEAKPPRRQ
jgi:hypothetical protein